MALPVTVEPSASTARDIAIASLHQLLGDRLSTVASVCITHAGFNTVLEALTQGVPQIAIPVTNDQPGVAARIAHKKTGKTTSLDGLDASNLSALLDEVLNDPIYRENSRSIQNAIARKNGLSLAADLLEQAFGLTHNPVYEAASEA